MSPFGSVFFTQGIVEIFTFCFVQWQILCFQHIHTCDEVSNIVFDSGIQSNDLWIDIVYHKLLHCGIVLVNMYHHGTAAKERLHKGIIPAHRNSRGCLVLGDHLVLAAGPDIQWFHMTFLDCYIYIAITDGLTISATLTFPMKLDTAEIFEPVIRHISKIGNGHVVLIDYY